MKTLWMLVLLLPCVAPAHASDRRLPCETLRTDIAVKIERNGISAYTLEIIDAHAQTDAVVVGHCNGGKQTIVYRRREGPLAQPSSPAAGIGH